MKKIIMQIALLCVPSLMMSAQETPTMDLTLEKAIQIALDENPTIQVADKEIKLKKIANREAWEALIPTLTANGNIQHTLLAAEMKLNGNSFKMGKDGTNTVTASGTLALPIFNFSIFQNAKLTKEDIRLAREKARGSRIDLVHQVKKAYYQLLLAYDACQVMTEAYNVSLQSFNNVNEKYKVGKVSEYDKLTAEVQMRNMNSSKISSENDVTLVELQLKVLMGITEDVKLIPSEKLRDYEGNLKLVNTDNEDYSDNSSLRQLDYNFNLLRKTKSVLYANLMPTLSFSLTGQYQSQYNENWKIFDYQWSPSANFAISLTVPIFNISNYTKIKSSKLKISQLNDTRVDTERKISVALKSYKKNMQSILAEIESDKQAISQANQAVNISSKRYEVGRGTVLDMNQSQLSLTQAQLTYNRALYNYLTNLADYDYTLGKEDF